MLRMSSHSLSLDRISHSSRILSGERSYKNNPYPHVICKAHIVFLLPLLPHSQVKSLSQKYSLLPLGYTCPSGPSKEIPAFVPTPVNSGI